MKILTLIRCRCAEVEGKFPARHELPAGGYVNGETDFNPSRRCAMAFDDKVDNKAEEVGGKVKEGVGKATDDEQLEAEGKTDQASANIKQAGEKIKDVFKS